MYQGQLTPVWERDATGELVQHRHTETNATGELVEVLRPVQARNPDGSLQWLTITKFSDTLLLARVKAYRKRYSTDRTELTGADGGPVNLDESTRVARVAQLLAIASARASGDDYTDLA